MIGTIVNPIGRPCVDLTGKTFGKLEVLSESDKISGHAKFWKCKCLCGVILDVDGHRLVHGKTVCCKKCNYEDLTGKQFTRLFVVKRSDKKERGYTLWECKCNCSLGNIVYVPTFKLKQGLKKSCGCMREEWIHSGNIARSHGLSKTIEFRLWNSMIGRCSKDYRDHADYYDRGITVCEEWKEKDTGFPKFLAHIGKRPSPKHSLDRVKNDEGYKPGNVKWSTSSEQNKNRRKIKALGNFSTEELIQELKHRKEFIDKENNRSITWEI
jgi:hypothetical protein